MNENTLTPEQSRLIDLHVLYQVRTGNTAADEAFIVWTRDVNTVDPMEEAIDLITDSIAPFADITIAQAKRITWELAKKITAAVKAVRGMEQAS